MRSLAVPVVKALEQASDWSKVVEPYYDQFWNLPSQLNDVAAGRETLLELYVNTNPLVTGFAVSIFLGAVFLVVAEINKNYSQVDRCWSLLPTFYNAHFALWARLAGYPHKRVDAILFWSVIWSTRLTFNYWRRGGYEVGSEDYRWAIIRRNVPAWVFHIFNWTFISFIQSALLFALSAPTYVILLASQLEPDLKPTDYAFIAAELALIAGEFIADQQQWNYHGAKSEYQKSGKIPDGYEQADLERGFLTKGMWAYSRHPAFACEQSIWFTLYQWSCVATKSMYNWSGAGVAALIMLFQGSVWITELISAGKYKEYKEYQTRVGMFVPRSVAPYRGLGPKVIRTSELSQKKGGPKQS